ncbi:hypothetical protein ACWC3Y_11140 [Streptomyces sp. NPDC001296]
MSPTPPNASREQIGAAIGAGKSNLAIARELRVDKGRVRRIREELGEPKFIQPERTRTLEEKWALFTKPIEGGHLEWTGTRGTTSGTPVLSYKEKLYSAAAIAFKIKHGREPHGYVKAECDVDHCVAPDCVDDEAGRQRTREQFRYLMGGQERPAHCVHGHDQAEHGRYEPDGTAYCEACKREQRRTDREAVAS